MGGLLVQQGATVLCAHGARAVPAEVNPRVRLSGMPACDLAAPWVVANCPGPPASTPPCRTAAWSGGTTRVTSLGRPLLVQSSLAVCAPSGLPLRIVDVQSRVSML